MTMVPLSTILLFTLFCHVVSSVSEKEIPFFLSKNSLKFFSVISRHGSRSPLKTFPNDPYPYTDRKFWPNGPAELTNLGKVQLYHTGQYIKERYRGFLEPQYNPNTSKVTYNPYNRDYMSSACLTAGMYPPSGEQIWNPALLWQPVVQDVREFDVCDLAYNDLCPKFKKLYHDEIDKFNENTEKHKDLLQYLSKNTGMNYTLLSATFDLYDTLLMQVQNGFKLPQWTKQVYPFKIRPLAVSYLTQVYSGSDELIKLGAGPELKYISDMLTMKANGTYDEVRKFYFEAAHDCTLICLLKALGNKDPNLEIQTGAYVLFELHYLSPNYVVQVFYYRTTYDEKPVTVEITACPRPCTLDNFNKFVNSINPSNYEEACKL